MASTPALAEVTDPQVIELKRQLQQREAEIEALRQQVKSLAQQRNESPAEVGRQPAPSPGVDSRGAGVQATKDASNSDDGTAALERALVLQGGGILGPGKVETVPEVFYVYDEPIRGERRDTFGTAVTARLGLPWSLQVDLNVPYVIRDRWSNHGHSSGVGDVRLGLTKQLLGDYERATALFFRGEWRLPTGSINDTPPTGFGQHAVQVELTATKQDDPFVLFGNISYTRNLGAARLSDGTRLDSGDVVGGRLGAFLAATPDVSLLAAIAVRSSASDRYSGQVVAATDRLRGILELGVATTVARNIFLDVNAGIGFTRAAPDFVLSFSIPYRF